MLQTHMDAERFIELYEETLDDVYRYAARLTGGDRIRTDELVQETYLGVMRRLQADDGDQIEPTLSYLIVACRHRFVDRVRSEQRRRRREERAAAAEVELPPIEPADLDPGTAIAALAELGDDQRAALVLRYVDDLTVAEVAVEMDRSVRATESLLVRARNALRTVVEERRTP